MENVGYLLFFSFIGSIAGLIGGIVLLIKKNWADILTSFSVPLAAGVLLALSLLELFPEAVQEAGNGAFTVVLLTFVALFLVERLLFYIHHHQHTSDNHQSESGSMPVALVIIGDTIHNFLDGVVIGTSFMVNPYLSLLVSFSTFLHETPHEIADFGILLSKGWSKKGAFIANFTSALATFVGAFLSYFFADRIQSSVGMLLSIATGFFLYVATTDFLPEAAHSPKKYLLQQTAFFLLGILAIAAVVAVFPEIDH